MEVVHVLILRRRRSRNTTAAATRPVIEALESRQFLDATTFAVSNPNSGDYYGTVNQADPSGVWGHTWSVSQNNLPAHTHTQASIETQVVVNVDPNTGESLTSGTQDDGYIFVKFNGQQVGDPILIPAGTTEDTWLGGTVLSNAGQEGWEISTSDNVFIQVNNGSIQQGTYAGFAHGVTAYRGGNDGSVDLSLDGPTTGTVVYVEMPTNGILNLDGTPDDQLPNSPDGHQPYFTITGPSSIYLDETDSRPDQGFMVYAVPLSGGATGATIGVHMVDPYLQLPDFDNGGFMSVLEMAPNNGIPMQAGWWDGVNNTFWAKDDGPGEVGLYVNDHVDGEISNDRIDQLVGLMNDLDPAERDVATDDLMNEVEACPSAYVLNRLSDLKNAGNIPPESARRIAGAMGNGANQLNVHYNPVDGTVHISLNYWTPVPGDGPAQIDPNHRYIVSVRSPDGSLAPYMKQNGAMTTSYITLTGENLPVIYPYPKQASGTAQLEITVSMMAWDPNGLFGGGWEGRAMITELVEFTTANQKPTQPQ